MANALTAPARTYTATIVAICPADRTDDTKSALRALHTRTGVRPIVVKLGDSAEPPLHEEDGAIVIEGKALASPQGDWSGRLYRELQVTPEREVDVKMIPYFAWGNRGDSEMTVWLPLGR